MTVRDYARRIAASLGPAVRNQLYLDPPAAIRNLGVELIPVAELTSQRGAGGMCDGLSLIEHDRILYAPTPDSRRENFTLLHEFAHLLVERDDESLIWLADRDEPDLDTERLCDELAAMLLIPEETLSEVLAAGPATGKSLLELFQRSSASQPACAIALASRLRAAGVVLLIDRATAKVVHASPIGELAVTPRRGQVVPSEHPLRQLQPGTSIERKSYWATPWGDRQQYYLSATATEKRIYAVLSVHDLWQVDVFHAAPRLELPLEQPRTALRCRCGYAGAATGWPCRDCGRSFCPRCGDCDCARRAHSQVSCSGCFRLSPVTDIENELCSDCR